MLQNFEKSMNTCSSCPSLCQSACPVFSNDGNRSHAPWGLMHILNRVRKNELPLTPEITELSYHCVHCRACTEQCEHGIEIPPVLEEIRAAAVEENMAPPQIKGFIEKFHRHNNPYSKDLLHLLKKIAPQRDLKKGSSTVYFPSCTTIAKCPQTIRDTFSLFKKLKIEFVSPYLDPLQCCGYPLLVTGARDDFIDVAEVVYHSLKNHKTIITGDPACAYTLKHTYRHYHFNLDSRVMTMSEFLSPYLKNINYRLKKGVKTKLMYHDPCYLSRYLGQTDEPREMIARVAGVAPREFSDNQDRTRCSGQGGCYSIIQKDRANDITRARLAECHEKQISTVITNCPTCVFKMRKNSRNLVIKDLTSYLNDSIVGVKE